MMIYSQHFFRRRLRKIPSPSCLPIAIIFAVLCVCIIVITPPVITGIQVDLPALNTQPLEIFDDFKYITIYALDNGVIAVNNTAVKDSEVVDFIKLSYSNIKPEDIRIFIRSDKNVPYGTITNLLQILNDNGFANISLVGKYTAGIQEFN